MYNSNQEVKMKTITIRLDDELHKKFKLYALENNKSGSDNCHFYYPNFIYIFTLFSLSAFNSTVTELKLIASAAIIGFSNGPPNAYNTPAAIGMPMQL